MSLQAKPHAHFINPLVSGSSPDLVSGGNFLNQHYLKHYPHAMYASNPQHGTYENLSSIFNGNVVGRAQAVIVENPEITKHIKKVKIMMMMMVGF